MTDAPPAAEAFSAGIPALASIPVSFSRRQEVLHPTRAQYQGAVATLRDSGFETCADLTAADYLTAREQRPLPPGITAERFEVVVGLLSIEHRRRIRLRVQVPADDAHLSTLFSVYPGVENLEREVYDLFGIVFDDHPDMTRILMPEDWEGHPLRKDYGVGRVPVQFKGAPGPR